MSFLLNIYDVKRILLLVSLVLIGFTSNAQIQTPDTLQLSPKELFEESDDWNDLGILQSYVNFSRDVLSSSNLSVGIIGRQISTTLNLGYHKSSLNGKWGHTFAASINPMWNYYGVGYGLSRNTEKRTTTIQTFYSTDFDFQKDITLSFIDVFRTQKWGTFGYSLTASKTFWGSYQGEWEGKYTVDTNGDFVDLIYPQMPASNEMSYRGMVMYTYTFKTKRVDISPQIFGMSDVYKVFKDGGTSDFSYWSKFNLDLYYGTSMDWKITKRFVLNTNIRFNTTIDQATKSVGYKKENPIMFMLGTNFQF
jgi:hypothetical protein